MKNLLAVLKNSFWWQLRPLRVATIGIAGLLVQTAIFETLGFWLEIVRPSTAVAIGAEFGIVTNFLLNNRFAFNDRIRSPFFTRLLRFHLVVSGSLIIQWAFVFTSEYLTTSALALHGAYISGVLVGFISNYTGYRLWVWRHDESPQE
jgi:putative flippase GtrA